MVYRRSIIARTMSFYQQQQRLAPSFSHISTGDREELHTDCISRNSEFRSYIHNPFLMTGNNHSNFQLSRNVFQLRRSEIGVGYGLISHRNLSSASSEVAIAAADSFPPVAALQYLVDYVHCYTGFNWWASIAVTTLLLCVIRIPLLIHRQKLISSKYYKTLDRPQFLTLEKVLKNKADDIDLKEAEAILKEHRNKTGNIAAWGIVILDITMLSFFFAILNMAEKVPSFITGGTLWFTDLTTPDSMRLPVLLALTLWIRLQMSQLHQRVVLEGKKHPRIVMEGKNMDMFCGALALLVTVTLGFPKAIYCYWISSSLFSIAFSIGSRKKGNVL